MPVAVRVIVGMTVGTGVWAAVGEASATVRVGEAAGPAFFVGDADGLPVALGEPVLAAVGDVWLTGEPALVAVAPVVAVLALPPPPQAASAVSNSSAASS